MPEFATGSLPSGPAYPSYHSSAAGSGSAPAGGWNQAPAAGFNQAVPERYVQRLRDRLEQRDAIRAVTRIEAVYLSPTEVLVAADVRMTGGLAGDEVAAILVRTRADVMREVPVIARLYLTPVA